MNSNCETCDNTTKMYLILDGLFFANPATKLVNGFVNGLGNRLIQFQKWLKSFVANEMNQMIFATVGYMVMSVFIMITAYAIIVY